MRFRFSLSPTAVAAFFTLAALGLPCVAWYVTGSRAARQEAEQLRSTPRIRAELDRELFRELLLLSGLYVSLTELANLEAKEVDPAHEFLAVFPQFL